MLIDFVAKWSLHTCIGDVVGADFNSALLRNGDGSNPATGPAVKGADSFASAPPSATRILEAISSSPEPGSGHGRSNG